MSSLLYHAAVVNDEDHVGAADSGEAVRDDYGSLASHQIAKRVKDEFF